MNKLIDIPAIKAMTIEENFHNTVNRSSLAAIVIFLISLLIVNLSAGLVDNSALLKLISQNEDAQMSTRDLAFLLVTHNFDATPDEDHVEVKMGRSVYKLVPNGRYAGLANITEIQ